MNKNITDQPQMDASPERKSKKAAKVDTKKVISTLKKIVNSKYMGWYLDWADSASEHE